MLPDEILINILIHAHPDEMGTLCTSSSRVRRICRDNLLWYDKIKVDYPEEIQNKPKHTSWRDWYIFLYQNPLIPIYNNNEIIGLIRIYNNDPTTTFDDLHRHFLNMDSYYTIQYYGNNDTILYEYIYINPIPSLNRFMTTHISFDLKYHDTLSNYSIKYIVLTTGRR